MAGINLDVSGLKVLLEPVSAQTFSLTVPSAVPAVVEVLATGPQGPGVPAGGVADDLLVKQSGTNYDTAWQDEITVDALQFDVTADEDEPATGQLVWNAEEGTLDLGLNGVGGLVHLAQETLFRVSNRTGSTIPKGAVVGFGGTIGSSGKLLGVLFDASSMPAKTIMGVATEAIPDDDDGYVVAFGKVRKVNTAFPGSVEGDILFADPATPGGLTRVQPVAPNAIVTVAALVTRSATVGELFVRPTFSGALAETQDVLVTGPVDGQVLTYDDGLWVNSAVPADAVQSVNGQTGTVVLDAADVGAYADDNPSGFVDAAGAAAAAPVQSVNGDTGTIVLDATDVGAYPDSNPSAFISSAGAPVQSVNGLAGTVVLDAAAVGAYADTNPSGFVDAAGAAAAAPVQTVNGASGTVVLDSDDVGAIGTATGLFVFDYGTAIPDSRPDAAAVFWRGTAQPGTAIALAGDIWYDSTGD